ncbi:hypothetical protein SteCoe_6423 [Stentor coeruleus]|uniref:Uncharacterized protein n=1 Tax=Stentor coeruleus TaxID=5963 RepID=A0A1R2CPX9_9CILI|nr:hypothetical protein SteCoe_6423 [Stentor coeruleus]
MWQLIYVLLGIASSSVIGVDLGSELIKTSLIRPGKKLLIVENEQSKRSTPMALAFTDKGRQYGYNALQEQSKRPETTVLFAKNLFGKVYNSDDYFLRTFQPLKIVENSERNSTMIKIGNENYETEEIVAMILEYVKEMSKKFGEGSVKDCVITIPSFWTRGQRIALISSAHAAGLNVLALMHENTGAAFYYAIDRLDNETDHYSLFYNLGASYLQVTLAKYSSVNNTANKQLENVEILAHAYDDSLGGSLFDSLLANYLAEKFKEIHSYDITSVPKSMVRLFQQANQVKKTLSANKSVFVIVNSLYKGIDFKYTLTREEFENLIKPYTDRLIKPVFEVLEKSGVEISQVNTLEIIGGVSRIPKVQELLKEKTGIDTSTHLNGDESMAHGAAIYAANFSSVIQVKPMWLSDIGTKTYIAKFYSEDDESWSKEIVLFKEEAKLGGKKKITFSYNRNLVVFIEEEFGDKRIPLCFNEVKGISELEKEQVNLFFSFILDYSGIPFLHAADAKYDVKKNVEEKQENKDGKKDLAEDGVEGNEEEDSINNDDGDKGGDKEKNGDSENTEENVVEESKESTENNEKNENADKGNKENTEENKETTEENKETTEENKKTTEKNDDNGENDKNEEISQEKPEETTESTKPKKKIPSKTVSLKLHEVEIEQPQMITMEKVSEIIKRLKNLKEAELQAKKVAEAKNNIESYIYEVSEKIEDEDFIKFISEAEKDSLSEKTSELRIWIETDEFESSTASEINSKKRELESLIADALQRIKEYDFRESAIENAFKILGHLQDDLIKLNETKPWISLEETVLAWVKLNETDEWVRTKSAEQAKLENWEPLVFRISELENKISLVEKHIEKLKRMQKPKPPGKKPTPDSTNFGEDFDWRKFRNFKTDDKETSADSEKDSSKDSETEKQEGLEKNPSQETEKQEDLEKDQSQGSRNQEDLEIFEGEEENKEDL